MFDLTIGVENESRELYQEVCATMEEEAEGKMDHRLQLQELWHLNGGGGETQTPSGEEQEDQLDEERCAGLQEVKRSRKAIENHSSAEALFSATGKNKNPELIVTVSN